ncbi:1-acyl-sn-glycerol-3-phosphate acyltransferase [Mycoplasma sp. NEAQ87857]|uniref:lysophospholipid acyltransferase family protein n=1 Tax=Mycoplasma sp. NEAQ87857 TaxID=2683967 RepID=UPI001315BE44|nr:lysophospholipid acyltransferase family protein [Mycoplasma sp. NEAQ87857]QGZ97305.1 1-acyl-sn-glycerol-3-phosphate acyltransferase [Mycoplasma sp. NEAQ87857]
MKKIAINTTLKKVLFSPIWLWRAFSLRMKARKYKKTPEMMDVNERYKYILKLSKKIMNIYNVDLVVEGFENLPNNGGVILAPNHKSNMDPLAIIAALEKQTEELGILQKIPVFVAKEELGKKFMVKNALTILDTTLIDRKNFRESIQKLSDFGVFVKENKSYGVIFPEGTRIKGKELGEFKAGAFKIAQTLQIPIVPVAIYNSETAFDKQRKGRLKIVVSFLKPLKPTDFIMQDNKSLGERVKNLIQRELRQHEQKES